MLDPRPTGKHLHHHHLCLQPLFSALSLSTSFSLSSCIQVSISWHSVVSICLSLQRGSSEKQRPHCLPLPVLLEQEACHPCCAGAQRESLGSKAHVKVSGAPPGTGVLLGNQGTKLAEGLLYSEGSRAGCWARAGGTKRTWLVVRTV